VLTAPMLAPVRLLSPPADDMGPPIAGSSYVTDSSSDSSYSDGSSSLGCFHIRLSLVANASSLSGSL